MLGAVQWQYIYVANHSPIRVQYYTLTCSSGHNRYSCMEGLSWKPDSGVHVCDAQYYSVFCIRQQFREGKISCPGELYIGITLL